MKPKPTTKAEKVLELFTRKAGAKLEIAREITEYLMLEKSKTKERAMADALEQLKLNK